LQRLNVWALSKSWMGRFEIIGLAAYSSLSTAVSVPEASVE